MNIIVTKLSGFLDHSPAKSSANLTHLFQYSDVLNTVNVRKPNVRFSLLFKMVRFPNSSAFERRSITEPFGSVIERSVID